MKLYASIKSCLKMINDLERSRAKLLTAIASSNSSEKENLVKKEDELWKIEAQITNIYQSGARFDVFRNPGQLFERFLALSKDIQIGSADFPPTDQQLEVNKELNKKLEEVQLQFNKMKL